MGSVRSARAVVAMFALSLAYGILLLVAFEPGVQGDDAGELLAREDDARSFLVADMFFPVLYGVLSPLALWRFGRAIGAGAVPRWVAAAALFLAAGALCDLAENSLLLFALDGLSGDAVDAAHAVAIPKLIFFLVGFAFSVAVLVRAVRELRRPPPAATSGREASSAGL